MSDSFPSAVKIYTSLVSQRLIRFARICFEHQPSKNKEKLWDPFVRYRHTYIILSEVSVNSDCTILGQWSGFAEINFSEFCLLSCRNGCRCEADCLQNTETPFYRLFFNKINPAVLKRFNMKFTQLIAELLIVTSLLAGKLDYDFLITALFSANGRCLCGYESWAFLSYERILYKIFFTS